MGDQKQGDTQPAVPLEANAPVTSAADRAAQERQARQAAELRRNLQRRKTQQRDRRDQSS